MADDMRTEIAGTTEVGERDTFKPTWLVDNEDELRSLSEMEGSFGKRIKALHQAVNSGFDLNEEEWRREFFGIRDAYVEEEVEDETAFMYLGRMTGHYQSVHEAGQGVGAEEAEKRAAKKAEKKARKAAEKAEKRAKVRADEAKEEIADKGKQFKKDAETRESERKKDRETRDKKRATTYEDVVYASEDEPDEELPRFVLADIEGPAQEKLRKLLGEHAERVVAALGDQTEELVEEYGFGIVAIVDVLGDQTAAIVKEFGEQTKELVKEVRKVNYSIEKQTRGINAQFDAAKTALDKLKQEDFDGLRPGFYVKLQNTLDQLTLESTMQRRLIEETTPENLRIPTPERMFGYKSQSEFEKLRNEMNDPTFDGLAELSGRVGEKALELREEARSRLRTRYKRKGYSPDVLDKIETELLKDLKNFVSPILGEESKAPDRSSKIYQTAVKDWFEEQIRYMETGEEAFEEQPEVYQRVSVALSYFRFRPETRVMGDDLYEKIEARRVHKRNARVFGITPPDGLLGEAAKYTKQVFKEMFTYKIEDSLGEFIKDIDDAEPIPTETPIAKAFIEYKKKCEKTYDKDDRKEDKKAREKEVRELYYHGGRVTGEVTEGVYLSEEDVDEKGNPLPMFVDQAIRILREKESKELTSDERSKLRSKLKELEIKLWSRRIAGELFNVSFEMSKHNIIIGTSGFFAARVMNFPDFLEDKGEKSIFRGTRAIWENMDLGHISLFDKILEKRIKKRESNIREEDRDGKVKSADLQDIGTENFWDKDEEVVMFDQLYAANRVDSLQKADRHRQTMWGNDNILFNISATATAKALREVGYESVPDKGIEGKGKFGDNNVSKREEKYAGQLDNTLAWMVNDKKDAERKLEQLKFYAAAERKKWIDEFATQELVTDKQKDHFYKKYLWFPKLPIISWSLESRARWRVNIDSFIGALRENAPYLTLGSIIAGLKKAFAYIFSD